MEEDCQTHHADSCEHIKTVPDGKGRNKHTRDRKHPGQGAVGKQAVVGMLERGGDVVAYPIDSTRREALQDAVDASVAPGATIYTDDHPSYH